MKRVVIIICAAFSVGFLQAQISSENFVEVTKHLDEASSSKARVAETISYFDGLGRLMEQIQMDAGGNSEDIITYTEYDNSNRVVKQYLPLAIGPFNQPNFVNLQQLDYSYYDVEEYDFTTNPYQQNIYSSYPDEELRKSSSPGPSWQWSGTLNLDDHTIKSDVGAMSLLDNIIKFDVNLGGITPVLVVDAIDPVYTEFINITSPNGGLLLKKSFSEQATDPLSNDHSSWEFVNNIGQTLVLRSFNGVEILSTYYVYDSYGNLTFVLPPEADHSIIHNDAAELDRFGYQYVYDQRNRLIEKKLPGKDREYIIYDQLDRPILTQDGNQRMNDQWVFTKYDVFGRIVYTGLYIESGDRETVQTLADNFIVDPSEFFEEKVDDCALMTNRVTIGGFDIYYTNRAFPDQNIDLLAVQYYDDYCVFPGVTVPTNVYGQTVLSGVNFNLKSLPTISQSRVLGFDDWITTVLAYDVKGRIVWEKTTNEFLDTEEIKETMLDFLGNPLTRKTQLYFDINAPSLEHTINQTFLYDHYSRLYEESFQVGDDPNPIETIYHNKFDELGLLETKQQHGRAVNVFGQDIDYQYNIRGWLKAINY